MDVTVGNAHLQHALISDNAVNDFSSSPSYQVDGDFTVATCVQRRPWIRLECGPSRTLVPTTWPFPRMRRAKHLSPAQKVPSPIPSAPPLRPTQQHSTRSIESTIQYPPPVLLYNSHHGAQPADVRGHTCLTV